MLHLRHATNGKQNYKLKMPDGFQFARWLPSRFFCLFLPAFFSGRPLARSRIAVSQKLPDIRHTAFYVLRGRNASLSCQSPQLFAVAHLSRLLNNTAWAASPVKSCGATFSHRFYFCWHEHSVTVQADALLDEP